MREDEPEVLERVVNEKGIRKEAGKQKERERGERVENGNREKIR